MCAVAEYMFTVDTCPYKCHCACISVPWASVHLTPTHTHTQAPRAVGALVSVSECLERLESV